MSKPKPTSRNRHTPSPDRHLKVKDGRYHLKLPVPRDLQAHWRTPSGKPRLHVEEALGTADRREAMRRRDIAVGEWQAEFARQRKALAEARGGTAGIDVGAEIARWRERVRLASTDADPTDPDAWTERDIEIHRAEERAEALAKAGATEADIDRFAAAVRDANIPTLAEAFAEWMPTLSITNGTRAKYRHALDDLLAFLGDRGADPRAVTFHKALAYVDQLNGTAISARGKPFSSKTKRDRLAALSHFWRDHLIRRRIVAGGSNPWMGHKITMAPGEEERTKRPFTDTELVTLFSEGSHQGRTHSLKTLAQFNALGMFTGARLDEIASLLLGDLAPIPGGYLVNIRRAKTKAGVREIPVLHPIPTGILRERIGDRTDAGAQLFADLRRGGIDAKLSDAIERALGYHRRGCGLTTETDFHSHRRTFTTRLERLGVDPLPITRYVGHKPPGMTFGLYSAGGPEPLLKVAEAIRYSPEVESAIAQALAGDTQPSPNHLGP